MWHQINIFIHILAGIIGMFIAIGAYSSAKGGTSHRRFGRIFLILMAILIVTAFNGVLFFQWFWRIWVVFYWKKFSIHQKRKSNLGYSFNFNSWT